MTSPSRRRFVSTCLALTLPVASHAQQTPRAYDLVIRGGIVVDPAHGLQARTDVGIRGGRIAAIDDLNGAPATQTLDADGRWVVPGLVDLQIRGYTRQAGLAHAADEYARNAGVVAWASAGDLDADDIGAFRRESRRHDSRSKAYAFINFDRRSAARDDAGHHALARTLAEQHDIVLGLMLRFDEASSRAPRALLDAAIDLLRHTGTRARILCPLIASTDLDALLAGLRPGDILTGLYGSGTPLLQDGKLHTGIVDARRRGVLIDVGHGGSRFDPRVARAALVQGFMPDVISSASHIDASPANRATSRPICDAISNFLDLGLGMDQVLAMATSHPARVIGRDVSLGTMALDSVANIAVLDVERRAGSPTQTRSMATLRNGSLLRPKDSRT